MTFTRHQHNNFLLFHSLLNIYTIHIIGTGLFHDIVTKAEEMTIAERIELLETNEQLAIVHKNAAMSGQTKVYIYMYIN